MQSRRIVLALALSVVMAGCTVIDVRTDPLRTGIRSDAMIEGYATMGWAQDPSFLEVQLFGGRSPGSLLLLELWYLARVEIGLVGLAVGVGPFDAGIGTLFYHPKSPAAPRQRQLIGHDHAPPSETSAPPSDAGSRERQAEEAEDALDDALDP